MSIATTTCAADTMRESSPLHTIETAFAALCAEPQPLGFFGAAVHPQLPARWIPLDELRKALIAKKYDLHVCDAVWREIIDRSRAEGAAWTVAAAGMAAPALKWVARMYSPDFDGDRDDLDAEILTGFLEHVATIDTSRPAILHRLRFAAQRAGERAAKADAAHRKSHAEAESAPPKSPWGHPGSCVALCASDKPSNAVTGASVVALAVPGSWVPASAVRTPSPLGTATEGSTSELLLSCHCSTVVAEIPRGLSAGSLNHSRSLGTPRTVAQWISLLSSSGGRPFSIRLSWACVRLSQPATDSWDRTRPWNGWVR